MIRAGLIFMLVASVARADTLPFIRKTQPTVISVSPTAVITPVAPVGGQFRIVNPLVCDIRIIGSDGTSMVTSTTGTLILGRSVEVLSITKTTAYVSTMSVASSLAAACSGTVEVTFGSGQ